MHIVHINEVSYYLVLLKMSINQLRVKLKNEQKMQTNLGSFVTPGEKIEAKHISLIIII